MKKIVSFAALAACLLSLSACLDASASIVSVGDVITVRHNHNYRTGSGGEFQVGKVNAPAQVNYFHTFCAETTENLGGTNQQYYVQSIGTKALLGGGPNTGILTSAAAKLYRDYYDAMASRGNGFQGVTGNPGSYAAGGATSFTLANGAFTFDMTNATTRANSAQIVQNALWNMMGYGVAGNALSTWYNSNVSANSGFYQVRIANLVFNNDRSRRSQDQFVVIPEPGSMLVWGVIGLAGLGFSTIRRREV